MMANHQKTSFKNLNHLIQILTFLVLKINQQIIMSIIQKNTMILGLHLTTDMEVTIS